MVGEVIGDLNLQFRDDLIQPGDELFVSGLECRYRRICVFGGKSHATRVKSPIVEKELRDPFDSPGRGARSRLRSGSRRTSPL
jgi:hypothetical protein